MYKHAEYEAPAKYDFEYAVHDDHTGDIKEQHESRDGDNVHGSYSLIDADGYKRTVEYTADEHNGFNAVVHREPTGHKAVGSAPVHKYVAAAPVAHHHYAPQPQVYHAAPVVAKVAAPVAHYAPAPVTHYAAPKVAQYNYDAGHSSYHSPSANYHY